MAATRQVFGRQFNYRALWEQLCDQGDVVSAIAYATHRDDDGLTKFQDALKYIGFTVKLKPYIQRSDGSSKDDWDVGIAVDVMTQAPQVDTVVLLSGNGDFDVLAGAHQRRPWCANGGLWSRITDSPFPERQRFGVPPDW